MMLSPDDCRNNYSGLLSLPTEIRCHIYDYLLADSQAITISTAYVTVFGNRIQDRGRKIDIPGLPLELTPQIRSYRDDSLLSVQEPLEVAIDDAPTQQINAGPLAYPAPMALLQTCHLINAELTDYKTMRSKKQPKQPAQAQRQTRPQQATSTRDEEGLSLYVSYPYGVLVLKSLYPFLLKQARNVYISGYYVEPPAPTPPTIHESFNDRLTPSNSFYIAESFGTPNPSRAPTSPSTNSDEHRRRIRLRATVYCRHESARLPEYTVFPPSTADHAPLALDLLVRTLFSPTSTQSVKLTAHILYPGQNTYPHVYGSANSPIVHMLRNVCGGDVYMTVKRGQGGTGLCFSAKPRPVMRSVSTCWENWSLGRARDTERGWGRAMDGFLREI
ncbi:hypothetical protein NX059_001795 [Plenodomus lindquistii]|nr:hypothetical protein NX059_001795 [Plenodomus lindquistii]